MSDESPFGWDRDLEPPEGLEARKRAEAEERASRFKRVFKDSPDGAAILQSWRVATVEAVRGPGGKDVYSLGYMDGQSDMVRQIDRLIRYAEEGLDGTQ